MDVKASNPAKIIPNLIVWFRYNKGVPLGLVVIALAAAVAYFVVPATSPHHVRLKLIPLATLAMAVAGWLMVWRHSFLGDANPGLVLDSEDGPAVAALMNMSKNGGMEPAIRIRAMKVLDAAGARLPQGTPLAVVCEYGDTYQNKDSSRWGDVNGLPANWFTDKTERVSQILAGFDEETWEFLEEGLESLPSHKPGIYFLNDLPSAGAD